MIQHFPTIKGNTTEQGTQDILRSCTREIDADSLGFAERVSAHFSAILASKHVAKGNKDRGAYIVICVYDALLAMGVDPAKIELSVQANPRTDDHIGIKIDVATDPPRYVLLYVHSSLRERWKVFDREARVAKDVWGNRAATTALLFYDERGLEGFLATCENPVSITKSNANKEAAAIGLDYVMALSQPRYVNAFMSDMIEAIAA
jgi:hypothetical protein